MGDPRINSRLSGNGVPINERKLLLVGSVFETILNKDLFPSNADLHSYVEIFERLFKITDKKTGERGYRPYLFKDRTLLAARVGRKITETNNAEIMYKLIDNHVSFLRERSKIGSPSHPHVKKKKVTTLLDDFNSNPDDSK